jgi:DNA-directed RNA polymerase subunit M/transcription elongation factor TFIIS
MELLNPAEESRRLTELYRNMSDEELIVVARQNSELTVIAQRALDYELSQRKLTAPPEEPAVPPVPEPSVDPEYAEETELVDLCIVWSLADALKLQKILVPAGIPFFMGPEQATDAGKVTSNFADGVTVQIMRIAQTWALPLMQHYEPADNPPDPTPEEIEDEVIRCPKCHSEEIIFDQLIPEPGGNADDSAAKFEWTCDACGHKWEDDGVVNEDKSTAREG